jgi:hypothetical protein
VYWRAHETCNPRCVGSPVHWRAVACFRSRRQPKRRARKPGLSDIEAEIAGLLDQSTQELRLAWRKLHRAEPPLGMSRDLLIRSLAYELEQRARGSPNLALRRRLLIFAVASERGALLVDPGVVLKAASKKKGMWMGAIPPLGYSGAGRQASCDRE